MIISRSALLRMRNVSDKIVEKIKTQFHAQYIFSGSRAGYEIMWRKAVEPERPQMRIQHGACALHTG